MSQKLSLRPYQDEMIEEAIQSLKLEQTALCIAPTGAGKTVILSQIIQGYAKGLKGKVIVLQHTKELLVQNQDKFNQWCPRFNTSLFNADTKDMTGRVIFSMVQTLQRHYKTLPKVDLLVIDEAHHCMANSYLKIIAHLKEKNPDLRILGMTATPNRGDRKGIKSVFKKVAGQIHLPDLIADGYLVAPRIFTVDAGQQQQLKDVLWQERKGKGQFSDKQSEWDKANHILTDNLKLNDEVLNHWIDKAYGKKTVIFCANIKHAKEIQALFNKHKIGCVHVNGEMSVEDRKAALAQLEKDEATVITNAAVLTEGWDYPPIECVILLRPMSYEATYIQMIGRGLRSHPNKSECIVLDFGMSSSRHKALYLNVEINNQRQKQEEKKKLEKEQEEKRQQQELEQGEKFSAAIPLKELAAHMQSKFLWEMFHFNDLEILMAGGFSQTAIIIKKPGEGNCYAYVTKDKELSNIKKGSFNAVFFECERQMRKMDFFSEHKHWMKKEPSEKQMDFLSQFYDSPKLDTSYKASLLISLTINQKKIDKSMEEVH